MEPYVMCGSPVREGRLNGVYNSRLPYQVWFPGIPAFPVYRCFGPVQTSHVGSTPMPFYPRSEIVPTAVTPTDLS